MEKHIKPMTIMKHSPQWISAGIPDLNFSLFLDKTCIRGVVESKRKIKPAVLSFKDKIPGLKVYFLNGKKMRTYKMFYRELKKEYSLPDYFGKNFDALEECLSDETIFEGTAFLTILFNAENVLDKETDEGFNLFYKTLNDVSDTWAKPIAIGEWWDRSAKPFHVIMQYKNNLENQLPPGWSDLPPGVEPYKPIQK